jgi:hypothetical protein
MIFPSNGHASPRPYSQRNPIYCVRSSHSSHMCCLQTCRPSSPSSAASPGHGGSKAPPSPTSPLPVRQRRSEPQELGTRWWYSRHESRRHDAQRLKEGRALFFFFCRISGTANFKYEYSLRRYPVRVISTGHHVCLDISISTIMAGSSSTNKFPRSFYVVNSVISDLNSYVYYQYSTILWCSSEGKQHETTKKLSELSARWQTWNIRVSAVRMFDLINFLYFQLLKIKY